MARRKKDRRQLALSDEVNEYLDEKAKTNDASATADQAIRDSEGFKKFQQEKKNEQ